MSAASFKHWHGGSYWHYRHDGYFGHLVQVVDDYGNLVAVSGKLRKGHAA
jgi:hypothetical protein